MGVTEEEVGWRSGMGISTLSCVLLDVVTLVIVLVFGRVGGKREKERES